MYPVKCRAHRDLRTLLSSATCPSVSPCIGPEHIDVPHAIPQFAPVVDFAGPSRYVKGMARAKPQRAPLTADEHEGIVLAVNSAFRKLKNLYARIVPIFEDFGFTPPSAGVIARDLSEKIEKAIIQHCESLKGNGHCDLCRFDQDWEVKICKDSGLTINQSKVINGENYTGSSFSVLASAYGQTPKKTCS